MNKRSIKKSSVSDKLNIKEIEEYDKRKEVLTSFFLDKQYKNNLTLKQIASLLQVPKEELIVLKSILDDLEEEGLIFLDDSKRYVLSSSKGYVKCVYEAKSKRFGFGITKTGEDLYISCENSNYALDKDEVLVKILDKDLEKSKTTEAKVVKILKRNTKKIIGNFIDNKNFGFVEPIDTKTGDVYIPKKYIKGYKTNDLVEVEITKYETKDANMEGKITGLIAKSNDKNAYIKALYKSFDLDKISTFNLKVLEELENIPDHVLESDKQGRIDKTNLKVVTIDSEDAKDLDDGCYVEKLDNGNYMLSVFIADVSHYVKEKTALNKEAISRGTSIYIPGTVIPMLPKKLSNGICSLNEGKERLALGVDILIDKEGKVLNSKVYKAVIKVAKKMTYEKVYKVIKRSDKAVLEEYKDFILDIDTMLELSKILYEKRKKNGSIDFDIKETKVYLDKDGNVEKICPYEITEANKIIEEFMLLTNTVIAEKFYFYELPFIYRIHEKPDEEKLRALNEILNNYSKSIKGIKNIHPKTLADIIDSITDEEEKEVISTVMLKTLRLAKYSNECLGHFGLAFKYYCHFTSPIRRYPDLFIHRVISDFIDNDGLILKNKLNRYEKQAYKYSETSSETEKQATKIEREFVKLYEAIYMKQFLGCEFDAVISSVTSFGMFVKLANTIEGFVAFENIMDNDYYIFDSKKNMLIGEHSKKTYKVSDKVRVRLERVDIKLKQIDFEIIKK